jgi:hypothetical protein
MWERTNGEGRAVGFGAGWKSVESDESGWYAGTQGQMHDAREAPDPTTRLHDDLGAAHE